MYCIFFKKFIYLFTRTLKLLDAVFGISFGALSFEQGDEIEDTAVSDQKNTET